MRAILLAAGLLGLLTACALEWPQLMLTGSTAGNPPITEITAAEKRQHGQTVREIKAADAAAGRRFPYHGRPAPNVRTWAKSWAGLGALFQF